jgi:hypothetical protein
MKNRPGSLLESPPTYQLQNIEHHVNQFYNLTP